VAVLELYRQGGFELDEQARELPDHVAVELEFLYLLNFKLNQARRTGDGEALASIGQLERRFLREHLGQWIVPFATAVSAGAETAFYRELGAFTERFFGLVAGSVGPVH